LISNFEFIFLVLIILIILILLNKKETSNQDDFLINLAVLDHVINGYAAIIYTGKITQLRALHNLDPASKINSIQSYEHKVNLLIAETTSEIMKLLTRSTKRDLYKRFSRKSIALYISNKIRNEY